jgi:hypothetical protein
MTEHFGWRAKGFFTCQVFAEIGRDEREMGFLSRRVRLGCGAFRTQGRQRRRVTHEIARGLVTRRPHQSRSSASDSRLRNGVKEQLETTRSGLKEGADSQHAVSTFDQISRVSLRSNTCGRAF